VFSSTNQILNSNNLNKENLMKSKFIISILPVVFLTLSTLSFTTKAIVINSDIHLYVDAAPNRFGSPDYAQWESEAFSSISNGTFTNMNNSSNSNNIGTTEFTIEDEVVYSFGDLGSRLTWIYWVPNSTIPELESNGFEVRLENNWNGVYDDFYQSYYGSSWLTPSSWVEFNGGVIGTAGMAYWGANGVNTPEALANDIADWGQADESWVFTARMTQLQQMTSLTSNRVGISVPEPSALAIFALALIGMGARRVRKK